MKSTLLPALALGAVVSLSTPVLSFNLDDIHFWVGEGTNRCAVVIDWSGYESALAWGYRWNGTCTNAIEVLRRVIREDPRLVARFSEDGTGFTNPTFFGYDVNDVHPTWDYANGAASDSAAMALVPDFDWWSVYWAYWHCNGSSFPTTPQFSSWYGLHQVIPVDKDWIVLSYGCPQYDSNWVETPTVLRMPDAAESPYGFQVIANFTTAKSYYQLASNVLGRPSSFMDDPSVMWQGLNYGGVVSPANPAWGKGRLFSLENDEGEEEGEVGDANGPGYVTIAFDHDVVDDPGNPWGLDFIVYGNSLAIGDGSYYTMGVDPSTFRFSGKGDHESAKVEVSQDGKTWYTDVKWRYADNFAPTLGHLYEPNRADASLYAGNKWWGRMTLPTRPLNPAVDYRDFTGLTLAQICQRYDGSAGGTAYDISSLPLPLNARGQKWFRYVRISGVWECNDEGDEGFTSPDIDAVADVAPVSGYELWKEQTYTDWQTAWDESVTGPEAIAANGQANALNYLLGVEPNETTTAEFRIAAFIPGTTQHTIKVVSKISLGPSCGLVVRRADSLSAFQWTDEVPIFVGSELIDGEWVTSFRVAASGGAFLKLAFQAD